jgi:hypothetical protein
MIKAELIAPCGMNCGVCYAYLRKDRKCPGCNVDDSKFQFTRIKCIIRNCENISSSASGFCYECEVYPCRRLKQLDKRYKTKYRMSMIENLDYIKQRGIDRFLDKEYEKWKCTKCGKVICCHNGICYNCEINKLKNRKSQLSWEDK